MAHLISRFLLFVFILVSCSTLSAQKMEGMASFYADRFDGRSTSTGETFRQNGYMAASKELPWGTIVEVTNLSNGRKVQVRINDCGPHARNRIIDLSRRAAQDLDFIKNGEAKVRLRIVRTSDAGPTCGRGAWAKKLKAAGKPIPPAPGAWKPEDTAELTAAAPAQVNPAEVPVVTPAPNTEMRGLASYYADNLAGQPTSTGERYDPAAFTAASKIHPYNSTLEVTNVASGQQVLVRVNDCGPHDPNRVLDLSRAAAAKIGLLRAGVASVNVRIVTLGTDGPTCDRAAWVSNINQNTNEAAATTGTPLNTEVTPPAPAGPTATAFYLQTGAFRGRAAADKMRDDLAAKGYRDAQVMIDPNGKGLWITSLSTYYDGDAAEQVKTQLINDGFKGALIKKTEVLETLVQPRPVSKETPRPNSVALAPPAEPRTYSSSPPVMNSAPSPTGQKTQTAYTIQLGAFGQERSAYELYDKLVDSGYADAYVYQNLDTKLHTTALQTVYDKATANKVKAELLNDGFSKVAIKEVQAFPSAIQSAPVSKTVPEETAAPETYGGAAATPKQETPAKTFEPDAILFGVQIGAYSTTAGAEDAKKRLVEQGVTEVYSAKVGKITRVFAGKYYFQDQANYLRDKLREAGFSSAVVRRVQ